MKTIIAIVLLFICTACNNVPKHTDKNWQVLNFNTFTLETPSGWSVITVKGIDSYIGGLTNKRDTLSFCYGLFCPSVSDENPEKHVMARDTVNGIPAQIVIPVKEGDGELVMSMKVKGDKFIISGRNIKSTDTILRIFKSILFQTSNPLINPPLTRNKFIFSPAKNGMKLFSINCACCHDRNSNGTGPALSGILNRRSFDWIYRFMSNRDSMKNDSIVKRMQRPEYCYFPDSITREDLSGIIDYIN